MSPKSKTNIFIPAETVQERTASVPKQAGLRSSSPSGWKLLVLPMTLFIALPILALFLNVTSADVWNNLHRAEVLQAINLSLTSAFTATLITLLFGTPVAAYLAVSKSRTARWVDTLMDLPTVLPPSVAGVALLLTFGRKGLLGPALEAFGLSIPFTTVAVVIAQIFIAAPYYIKAASIGFSNIDPELKQAAGLDGADSAQIFAHITLPLSWKAMLSGAVMTWARSLGEFGATIIFAGNFPGVTQTMPLAIYIGFQVDMSVAITLAVILISFSFLTLILVKGLLFKEYFEDQPIRSVSKGD